MEMRNVRHRVGLLGTITPLLLAAAVVTAGSAEARRNVGGVGGECLAPNDAVVQNQGAGLGATCICVIEPNSGSVLAGPNGPGSTCPPRILRNQERTG